MNSGAVPIDSSIISSPSTCRRISRPCSWRRWSLIALTGDASTGAAMMADRVHDDGEGWSVASALSGPLVGHRHLHDTMSVAARRELRVGDRTVIAVSDGYLKLEGPLGRTLVGTPEEPTAAYELLRAQMGEVRLPIGCFLIPGEPLELIDAGVGPFDYAALGAI